MAHELAHQWWGIGVACRDWSEFWLNEGIASFMADVFLGERYGQARYDKEIKAAQQTYEDLKSMGKDHALSYQGKGEQEVGGRLPYSKGAWVLHILRRRVGEDIFCIGLKEYTQSHWGQTATSKDLQAAMGEGSQVGLRRLLRAMGLSLAAAAVQ